MRGKHSIQRRKFLAGLGVTSALPFLEGVLGKQIAHAQPSKRLKRLVIVSQSHMSLGYHRIPDLCNGPWGNADPSLLKTDSALGLRVGAFPAGDPGKLGSFYAQGGLKSSPRLQKEMMVVNGLACTYDHARGHLSDSNGEWRAGGGGGKFNPSARYPLSGAVHQPMVTIDHVIAKKIHTPNQRMMFMGNARWGGGGADTNESIDFNRNIQGLIGGTRDIYNSAVFDGGKKIPQTGTAPAPTTPSDPLAAASTGDFAALTGLEFSQEERKRLLADTTLSGTDRKTLEQYYDLLNDSLKTAKAGVTGGTSGMAVSSQCKAPTIEGDGIGGYLKLVGSAFLCDLSRIAYMSVGSYLDHNGVWHAGADGNAGQVGAFLKLADQMVQVAEFLTTLVDPMTGKDMLENTLVLGITNNSLAVRSDGRDASHEMGDYSYFSLGGSAAFNTGFMYDALGHSGGKRPPVAGPVYTVNQYLQTLAAAFGLTAEDWSPAGGKGFGPWMSPTWKGRPLRVDDTAKTTPIPGLLKA